MTTRYPPRSALISRRLSPYQEKLPSYQRVFLVALGTTLLALLAIAAVLKPDSSGLGTHQQLGLPPCAIRVSLGVRCPSCGMTTSWAHYVRGQLLQSISANAGGTLLALFATFAAPWSIVSGLRGCWLGGRLRDRHAASMAVGVAVVVLVDWMFR